MAHRALVSLILVRFLRVLIFGQSPRQPYRTLMDTQVLLVGDAAK
jgi:hypothetical protein